MWVEEGTVCMVGRRGLELNGGKWPKDTEQELSQGSQLLSLGQDLELNFL
jgi:hypothetical protein